MKKSNISRLDPETRNDAPWRNHLAYRLQCISTAFRNQTADLLSKTDLIPTQWNLLHLMITTNATSSKELLEATDLGKVLVSRTLQGMEKQGLVDRYKDESDLRVDRFQITNLGMKRYESARPIMEARQAALDNCFDKRERMIVHQTFDAIESVVARRDF